MYLVYFNSIASLPSPTFPRRSKVAAGQDRGTWFATRRDKVRAQNYRLMVHCIRVATERGASSFMRHKLTTFTPSICRPAFVTVSRLPLSPRARAWNSEPRLAAIKIIRSCSGFNFFFCSPQPFLVKLFTIYSITTLPLQNNNSASFIHHHEVSQHHHDYASYAHLHSSHGCSCLR